MQFKITQNGWTPLHIASKLGYADAVRAIIATGAGVDVPDKVKFNSAVLAFCSISILKKSIFNFLPCLKVSCWPTVFSISMYEPLIYNSACGKS